MLKTKNISGLTGRKCQEKFKTLKTRLKNKVKRKPGGGKAENWPYLERMKEILKNDKSIFPDHVFQVGAAGEKPIQRKRKDSKVI